jgi:predicted short-subunit dehydrogenase-like oxidoreductase (DUF2520 family)
MLHDLKNRTMRLGIIGGGRAAWAFGSVWREAGLPLSGITVRAGSASPVPPLLSLEVLTIPQLVGISDVVAVAVSDRAIPAIASEVSLLGGDPRIFHCSGSLPSAVFGARSNGFSLHPFRALPAVGDPVSFRGMLMVYEGPDNAMSAARQVVESCGGLFGRISAEEKPRYHAAAVFAANYVAAMLQMSREILETVALDIPAAEAATSSTLRQAIVDLATSASMNWLHHEGAAAFTGPAARGEREVVAGHLASLSDLPDVGSVYRRLAAVVLRRTSGTAWADADDPVAKWLADSSFLP